MNQSLEYAVTAPNAKRPNGIPTLNTAVSHKSCAFEITVVQHRTYKYLALCSIVNTLRG